MRAIRQIKSLSISETRWLAYATAGVASALGLSPSAEAEIHYSGLLNIGMEHYNSVFLPLTNGASLNFTIFIAVTRMRISVSLEQGALSALAAYTIRVRSGLARLGKGDSIAAAITVPIRGTLDRSQECPVEAESWGYTLQEIFMYDQRHNWFQVQRWKRYTVWLGAHQRSRSVQSLPLRD